MPMTPEERALLERTASLAAENNAILRGIQRSNRTAMTMRVLYWAVIIFFSFGAYYLIQPYFTMLMGLTGSGSSGSTSGGSGSLLQTLDQAQNSANQLQSLLK